MCARFHSVERASPFYQNLSLAPVCPATPHLLHSLFHATFNPLDNLPSFPYLNSPPHLRNDSRACQHGLLPNLFQRTVWPFFDRCMISSAATPTTYCGKCRETSKHRVNDAFSVPWEKSAARIVDPMPNILFMRY